MTTQVQNRVVISGCNIWETSTYSVSTWNTAFLSIIGASDEGQDWESKKVCWTVVVTHTHTHGGCSILPSAGHATPFLTLPYIFIWTVTLISLFWLYTPAFEIHIMRQLYRMSYFVWAHFHTYLFYSLEIKTLCTYPASTQRSENHMFLRAWWARGCAMVIFHTNFPQLSGNCAG
jgi:hypothetical protein